MKYNIALPEHLSMPLTPIRGGRHNCALEINSLPHLSGSAIPTARIRTTGLEIFWINKGSVTLNINGADHRLLSGSACCIPPGQWCQLSEQESPEGYHLSLSAGLLHEVETGAGESILSSTAFFNNEPLLVAVDASMKMAEEIIWRMQSMLADLGSRDIEILKGYLRIFLLYLSRSATPAAPVLPGREQAIVNNFLALVRQKFTSQKLVAGYAADLCVTASYLNRVVKRVSGNTASHHIQQQVILEAKRLCRNSAQSMKEIAYGLGFSDIAHFSKFFKNYTGFNFSNFKRRGAQVDFVGTSMEKADC